MRKGNWGMRREDVTKEEKELMRKALEDDRLTYKEASELLGISIQTVRQWKYIRGWVYHRGDEQKGKAVTVEGVRYRSIAEAVRHHDIAYHTVQFRLKRGWSVEDAFKYKAWEYLLPVSSGKISGRSSIQKKDDYYHLISKWQEVENCTKSLIDIAYEEFGHRYSEKQRHKRGVPTGLSPRVRELFKAEGVAYTVESLARINPYYDSRGKVKYKKRTHPDYHDLETIMAIRHLIDNGITHATIRHLRAILARAKGRSDPLHKDYKQKLDGQFNITLADVLWAYPLDGMCPILKIKMGSETPQYTPLDEEYGEISVWGCAASIDRIDNKRGYVKGNIRIMSTKANLLKSDMTIKIALSVCNSF